MSTPRLLPSGDHLNEGEVSSQVVGDCEAFLAGRLVERIEQAGARVPVWAWTNLLAHGTERDLCSRRAAAYGASRTISCRTLRCAGCRVQLPTKERAFQKDSLTDAPPV